MQKLVDEVKGGWSQLFRSLYVTAEPKKETKQIIMKSKLSDIDKKALIKALDKVDDMGKNIFSYDKEENKNRKQNVKKEDEKQKRQQFSRNEIGIIEKQKDIRKDDGRGIGE